MEGGWQLVTGSVWVWGHFWGPSVTRGILSGGEAPRRGPVAPSSCEGSLFWQMRGFRGSPPASVPLRCLQLKIVSTSEMEQDPMVLVGLPSPTPQPCAPPASCLQKNFNQRICFIREVKTCRSKGKLVKQEKT